MFPIFLVIIFVMYAAGHVVFDKKFIVDLYVFQWIRCLPHLCACVTSVTDTVKKLEQREYRIMYLYSVETGGLHVVGVRAQIMKSQENFRNGNNRST